MPSIFSHAAIPLALGLGLGAARIPRPLVAAGVAVVMLPDLDVLAFALGIPYASAFGHRGFTHSLLWAAAMACAALPWRRELGGRPARIAGFLFAAGASHGLLDMATDGGLGVALLWPAESSRHFLPWRPIRVSPIGSAFFSQRGLAVLASEFVWVWLPAIAAGVALKLALAGREARAPSACD